VAARRLPPAIQHCLVVGVLVASVLIVVLSVVLIDALIGVLIDVLTDVLIVLLMGAVGSGRYRTEQRRLGIVDKLLWQTRTMLLCDLLLCG